MATTGRELAQWTGHDPAALSRIAGARGLGLSRAGITYAHDVVMAGVAYFVSLVLKVGLPTLLLSAAVAVESILCFMLVAAVVFRITRLHRSLWHFVSLVDMLRIVRSVTLATVLFAPLFVLFPGLLALPFDTLGINWFVLVALLSAPRVAFRLLERDRRARQPVRGRPQVNLLLVGAGDPSELFLRALERDASTDLRVVGIVDEMGAYLRQSIHGVDVLGGLGDLHAIVEDLDERGERPQRLVITEDGLSPLAVQVLLDEAESLGLTLNRIPRITELRGGVGEPVAVEPVAIEDLLGRPQAALDRAGMAGLVRGARVLVTGAGGTIGSELVRQISDFGPARLTLVDNSEFHLYNIDIELHERHGVLARSAVMADVRDWKRLRAIFAEHRPELVFHAAAMKHVPMVETNPCEGVLTNVVGTRNVADACVEFGVRAMVLISTDKAVNPTSVMGATKRVAESYCQALDIECCRHRRSTTRFFTVRFGNVLGSTGSVVPLFQRQLAAGGPLTVTDPHVTRYFMTTHEAVELVLQASALGSRTSRVEDRSGTIFVLEMGEPVRIQDLARQMIRLAGLRLGRDVDIVYTGLRPGEKLYEEPLHVSEELKPTEADGILLAAPRTADYVLLCRLVDELEKAATAGTTERVMSLIGNLVPEYQPTDGADGDPSVLGDGTETSRPASPREAASPTMREVV